MFSYSFGSPPSAQLPATRSSPQARPARPARCSAPHARRSPSGAASSTSRPGPSCGSSTQRCSSPRVRTTTSRSARGHGPPCTTPSPRPTRSGSTPSRRTQATRWPTPTTSCATATRSVADRSGIHRRDVQERVFDVMGINAEQAQEQASASCSTPSPSVHRRTAASPSGGTASSRCSRTPTRSATSSRSRSRVRYDPLTVLQVPITAQQRKEAGVDAVVVCEGGAAEGSVSLRRAPGTPDVRVPAFERGDIRPRWIRARGAPGHRHHRVGGSTLAGESEMPREVILGQWWYRDGLAPPLPQTPGQPHEHVPKAAERQHHPGTDCSPGPSIAAIFTSTTRVMSR